MSKVITKASWKSMDAFIAGQPADFEASYEYSGPSALCDRAAEQAASQAARADSARAETDQENAANERALALPYYSQEMKEQHAFTPGQTEELLTAEASGLGGAAGDTEEAARLHAARTRNESGFTKALDESARERNKSAAASAEAGGAKDVEMAKAANQAGAAGISQLFGEDLNATSRESQAQNQAIQDEIEAGKSGWLQNLTGVLGTLGSMAGGAGSILQGINK